MWSGSISAIQQVFAVIFCIFSDFTRLLLLVIIIVNPNNTIEEDQIIFFSFLKIYLFPMENLLFLRRWWSWWSWWLYGNSTTGAKSLFFQIYKREKQNTHTHGHWKHLPIWINEHKGKKYKFTCHHHFLDQHNNKQNGKWEKKNFLKFKLIMNEWTQSQHPAAAAAAAAANSIMASDNDEDVHFQDTYTPYTQSICINDHPNRYVDVDENEYK